MKTKQQIHSDIIKNFSSLTNLEIQDGTVIDYITHAVSDAVYQAYIEIQNNKNPHLYSNLRGNELDDLGMLVNCVRNADEQDDSYLHRLMEWLVSSEAANKDSIENALMNLKYSSYAQYVPQIYGVGTGAIYLIPISYDTSTQTLAINEAKNKVEQVKAGDSYIEYKIPPQKQISLAVHIEYKDNVDSSFVFFSLQQKIQDYINGIAIGDILSIGDINKIGINEDGVSYFVVIQMYIDDIPVNNTEYLQTIYNKFVFKEMMS